MEIRFRTGVASRLIAVAVVGTLLVALGAYAYVQMINVQGESRSSSSTLSSTQTPSSSTELQALSSPCADKPPTQSVLSKLYSNGTKVFNFTYPILTLLPGSLGTFCMTYDNKAGSLAGYSPPFSAFDWNSSVKVAGISLTANASSIDSIVVPPRQNATVVYTVEASGSSPGYYYLSAGNRSTIFFGCGSLELAVSKDPSTSSFSDFPGLLSSVGPLATHSFGCRGSASLLSPRLTGFNGFGSGYLQNTSRTAVPYNLTGRSVVSVVQSSTKQNITFSVGVRSFSFPLTLLFDTGPSTFDTLRVFQGNPENLPTPGDPCDWLGGENASASPGNMTEVPVESVPGITVNAPTIHMQPFTNATFKFSMEIDNPPPGYYITFLGFVIQWKNSPGSNTSVNLSTYFPINPPFGQLDENITGTCPVVQ